MTRPVHTVKYMQARFKKYQIIAIVCSTITVVAALFAALSGIQVNTLRKAQAAATASVTADQKERSAAAAQLIENLKQQLADSQQQLIAEKENVKNLIGKVTELERQLAGAEAKLRSQQQSTTPLPSPADSSATEPPPVSLSPEVGTTIPPATLNPPANGTEAAPSDSQ